MESFKDNNLWLLHNRRSTERSSSTLPRQTYGFQWVAPSL